MKLVSTVILYNPKDIGIDKVINNILSYAGYCEKVIIVDNSAAEDDGRKVSASVKNSVYIFNGNNNGIAGALNKACAAALESGYEYILTMDQDSYFGSDDIKRFVNLTEQYLSADEKIASFAPKINDLNESIYWTEWIRRNILSPLKRKVLGKRYKGEPKVKYPDEVFTSGNIIKLSAWKDVDGFFEPYFIDEVDFNFCHKLKRSGCKIIKFTECRLNHSLGKKTFALLPKHLNSYSQFRLYYIFRNRIIERYLFPEYQKKYDQEIKNAFFDNCINTIHPVRNFRVFLKAKKDADNFISNENLKGTSYEQ